MDAEGLGQLVALLGCETKRELEKQANSLAVRATDLATLAMTSEAFGYRHTIHYWHFAPTHLHVTPDMAAALSQAQVGKPLEGDARVAVTRMGQIFRERRYLVGHLFVAPSESPWHLFYFDQRDLEEHGNHWAGGSHVHFLNYLWPKLTARAIWERFTTGNPKMRGALHIRFIDDIEQDSIGQET